MKHDLAKRRDFEAHALSQLEDLYYTSLLVVDDESEAQHLVQETFAVAYGAWLRGQASADYRIWLFRIMAKALDGKCGPCARLSGPGNGANDGVRSLIQSRSEDRPPFGDFDQVALSEISEDDFRRTIRELPDHCRLTVVLFLIEGFSYEDIAEITAVRLEVVRSRLHQGCELVRDKFSSMWRAKAAGGNPRTDSGDDGRARDLLAG